MGFEPTHNGATTRCLNHLTIPTAISIIGWTDMEATPGFEPGNKGFADLCLTTWLCRRKCRRNYVFIDHRALTRALQSHVGDPDQARTDDLQRDRLAF